MGVALIGWGRFVEPDGRRITVPAPSTTPGAPWLWDYLATQAAALRQAGFTALQLPPASKVQGGADDGCDGYGLFDPRDLGAKPQQGSTPTRYGTAEALRRLVACCHAVGLDVYLDVVLHQLDGENGGQGVFDYVGADGNSLIGRGPMRPGCFRGIPPANRPQDGVPAPFDDLPYGREKVYQNCDPPGYTITDGLDYGDWLFRTTGADGMRFDDVKGIWAPFVSEFMRSRAMAGKFAYSEFFDGDAGKVNDWATSQPMSSRSLAVDFALHFALQAACNGGNAQVLDGAGFTAMNPFLSCTFVDNPDTDTTAGQAVVTSKLLAYAFMLSIEGYPFVYGKDYFPGSVWPGAYGLKPWIDNLIWIHENLAFGTTTTRFVDSGVIVINRTGGPGLLTALNFDTLNARTITCLTSFGPNVGLHDYAGHHPDITTDGDGRATFTIPSNAYERGQSYLCFSTAGNNQTIKPIERATSQTFFGAPDLDNPPASNGQVEIGRIWCADGSLIDLSLVFGAVLGSGAESVVEVLSPKGNSLGAQKWTVQGPSPAGDLQLMAQGDGWHTLRLTSIGLPGEGLPYELSVTYTATPNLA